MENKSTETYLNSNDQSEKDGRDYPTELPAPDYKDRIDWFYVVWFTLVHLGAIYGLLMPGKSILTTFYVLMFGTFVLFGITVGAHRLFSHKSFKANTPLKILLITIQTFNLQRTVYTWARDHRTHHKYTDTTADPHNSRRGFFFAHIGWLLVYPHPDVKKFSLNIDKSDLKADPYVMFQNRHHLKLITLASIVSTLIPWYFWGESLAASFFYGFLFRYMLGLHFVWSINSIAHYFGTRPYDVNITATNNDFVSLVATGEGYHNYHHTFPWDFRASESGKYALNWGALFIEFFSEIGWATDLKTVSNELVQKRIKRTGPVNQVDENQNFTQGKFTLEESNVWGWDDKEHSIEDKNLAVILNKTI